MVVRFFRCVAKAAAKHGMKRIAGLIGIEAIHEFCVDIYEEYRQDRSQAELRSEIEQVVALSHEAARKLAQQAVEIVAADMPADEKIQLSSYIAMIPSVARQSLRHSLDPTGKTVSPSQCFDSAIALLPLLPKCMPRFQPGDRPSSIGGWVLMELLGTGGFGEVWKAQHPDYPATVAAFKFCFDEAAQSRLLRHEGKVLNQVMGQSRHPGIVSLLDANLHAQPAWLKFEYVSGGDLSNLVSGWTSITNEKRVEYALRVVRNLSGIVGHFHRLNPVVIHRDLKPSNVLVQVTQGKTSLRVADFGIGMISQPRGDIPSSSTPNASVGATLGRAHTPLYASPQQRRGLSPDARDDVFSLGVIWYQLLVNDLAKEPPTGLGWMKRLKSIGVSDSMLNLLGLCLADDPEDRPSDGKVLSDLLREIALPSSKPEMVTVHRLFPGAAGGGAIS